MLHKNYIIQIFLALIIFFNISQPVEQIFKSSNVSLPFSSCIEDGQFKFNLTFRLVDFKELLANEEGEPNKCLSFFICYESFEEKVKPQFKIGNIQNAGCQGNLHGFEVEFCLVKEIALKMQISFSFILEKRNIQLGIFSEAITLRLQFESDNFLIFYGNEKMNKIYELRNNDETQNNFSLFNGDKMLRGNRPEWLILFDIALVKNAENVLISNNYMRNFQIRHPPFCSANSTNSQSILIKCVQNSNFFCEFDSPNRCGKKCRKKLVEHQPVAMISHGQSIGDSTKWPWMVAIESHYEEIIYLGGAGTVTTKFYVQCTGTIIHSEFILTAGHCLEKKIQEFNAQQQLVAKKLLSIEIFAGNFNISDLSAVHKRSINTKSKLRKNVIVHKNYSVDFNFGEFNRSFINVDLALIKLSKPIELTEKMMPICVANFTLQNNNFVYIAGWGWSEEMDFEGAGLFNKKPETEKILQQSSAKVIDNEECLSLLSENIRERNRGIPKEKLEEFMKMERKFYKGRYCLQGIGESTIQGGDSGGSMMFLKNGTWFNLGVASGNFMRKSLKEKPKPMYYTKINGEICDWIKNKTRGKVQCGGF